MHRLVRHIVFHQVQDKNYMQAGSGYVQREAERLGIIPKKRVEKDPVTPATLSYCNITSKKSAVVRSAGGPFRLAGKYVREVLSAKGFSL